MSMTFFTHITRGTDYICVYFRSGVVFLF